MKALQMRINLMEMEILMLLKYPSTTFDDAFEYLMSGDDEDMSPYDGFKSTMEPYYIDWNGKSRR